MGRARAQPAIHETVVDRGCNLYLPFQLLMRLKIFATALALSIGTSVHAQRVASTEFFPGGTYESAVPTPESVLGYPIGSYHTDYAGLERWLAALRQSPRVRVLRYGQSEERRPLYLIIVASPANLARLDEIRTTMARLADPRTTNAAEAARIAREMPAVAWLNHANDGNESAAFETAIQSSYQLAAGTDSVTRLILDRLVVVINPAHNPESHERFVAWYNSAQVGATGTADRAAAEHNAPWGMSTNNNHYQIDLNRDAFFVSQLETRALVRAFGEWNPVVFVDHHGQTKNMFFPPPAEAVNLNVTPKQREWMERYGNAIADAFDARGWSYYRRGRFDLFYAGFWDSWPTLNGSVGMTFETDGGGSRGLAWEREDGTILTLRDGVQHHFTGAMATLLVTARDKEQRLRDFYDYRATALAEGARESLRQVVLLPRGDASRARELARVLADQRIEVRRVTAPYRVGRAHDYLGGPVSARDVPVGAYVISMAQPQKRLAKALLELEPAFSPEFMRSEEAKKRRAELLGRWSRDGFYDVTAWSLPLMFGVDAVWSEDAAPQSGVELVTSDDLERVPTVEPPRRARYAYLYSPAEMASMRLTAQLLHEGVNLAVATQPFRALDTDYPSGSIIARVERNAATLHDRVAALAVANGVVVRPLDGARVQSGADFGEDPVVELERPRIAVVTGEPTDDRGYGATWFTLERRLGTPFTALNADQLRSADLAKYNTIVLPHGAPAPYQEMLGEAGLTRLRRWTQDGGTLVLIKGAAALATRRGVEWTTATLKRHQMPVRLFFDSVATDSARAGARTRADSAPVRDMDLVRTAGAIMRVKVDPEHWLSFGVDRDIPAVVSSNYAFTPSREGANVGAFPPGQALKLAGFLWPEAERALARSMYLWTESAGRGRVVLFADDPNFRASQLSTLRLFANAVLLGPSMTP
jgi:hypothetical protein